MNKYKVTGKIVIEFTDELSSDDIGGVIYAVKDDVEQRCYQDAQDCFSNVFVKNCDVEITAVNRVEEAE